MNQIIKNEVINLIKLAQKIKDSYPYTVCLMDCGMFYRCYDEDAYIISYLCGYKINSSSVNDMAGFPNNSIKEVTIKLMNNKIDYKIFKVNKYSLDVIDSFSFNDENLYEATYEKSYRYIKIKCKIERLSQKLIERIENNKIDDILDKIEKIICLDI